MTKDHKLGDLTNRNVLSRFWRLEVQDHGAGRFTLRPRLACRWPLHPHRAFCLCARTPLQSSSASKDTKPIALGPHPYDLI